MSRVKKKFINVVPISKVAKERFVNHMNNYHSCLVLEEDDNLYHLISINGLYEFHLQKQGNAHWKIVK